MRVKKIVFRQSFFYSNHISRWLRDGAKIFTGFIKFILMIKHLIMAPINHTYKILWRLNFFIDVLQKTALKASYNRKWSYSKIYKKSKSEMTLMIFIMLSQLISLNIILFSLIGLKIVHATVMATTLFLSSFFLLISYILKNTHIYLYELLFSYWFPIDSFEFRHSPIC